MKAFGDEASFISVSRAICRSCDTKDPFATHEIHVGFWWNKFPCAIVKERNEFGIHGSTPSWIFGGSSVRCWLDRVLSCGSKKCFGKGVLDNAKKEYFGLMNIVFAAGLHWVSHGLCIITWNLQGVSSGHTWRFRSGRG